MEGSVKQLCLVMGLVACGPAEDLLQTLPESGPYGVGYRETSLTYTESLTGEERTLRVALWYPTEDTWGVPVRYQGLYEAPDVWADAAPAVAERPLALYSHGHRGYAEASGRLMHHLASHGWIGVAPDHTGNTTFDDWTRTTESFFVRHHDLTAVLDWLEAGGDPLAEQLTGQVLGIGHSFGGYTQLGTGGAAFAVDALLEECAAGEEHAEFCSNMTEAYEAGFRSGFEEDRIQAVVSMASGNWEMYRDGLGQVDVPVVHMTGGKDERSASSNDRIWEDLAGDLDLRVHMPDAGHLTFCDVAGSDPDPPEVMEREAGWRVVEAYTLAYGRYHVLGDDAVAPVLDGETPIDADAVELSWRE